VIRVFIVAASPLARAGLQSLLGDRGVEVVGSIASIESLPALWPDVEANIVVLSDHSEPRWFAEALRAGVRAVLPGEVSADQLVPALEAVAAGLTVMHSAEVAAMFPAAVPASRPLAELTEPLTPRESEVLQMLASGLGNKEIAVRLAISEHTVKFHVASILGKLGAGSRTEAVSLGIRRGLVLL